MDILETLKKQIADNDVILYMKGSPEAPQCGFSMQAVNMLSACGKAFAFIDVLDNPEVRANLPKVANWPTFPQLYIKGELIGGCDIMQSLYESGELKKLLDAA